MSEQTFGFRKITPFQLPNPHPFNDFNRPTFQPEFSPRHIELEPNGLSTNVPMTSFTHTNHGVLATRHVGETLERKPHTQFLHEGVWSVFKDPERAANEREIYKRQRYREENAKITTRQHGYSRFPRPGSPDYNDYHEHTKIPEDHKPPYFDLWPDKYQIIWFEKHGYTR
jgi:hypothetical protein